VCSALKPILVPIFPIFPLFGCFFTSFSTFLNLLYFFFVPIFTYVISFFFSFESHFPMTNSHTTFSLSSLSPICFYVCSYVCSHACSYKTMTQVPAKLFLTYKFLCVPMCVSIVCSHACSFPMYNDTGASEAISHVQVPAGSKCSRLGLYKRQKMREKQEISAKNSNRGQMPCPRPSQRTTC
jgi:hypothetical protein